MHDFVLWSIHNLENDFGQNFRKMASELNWTNKLALKRRVWSRKNFHVDPKASSSIQAIIWIVAKN